MWALLDTTYDVIVENRRMLESAYSEPVNLTFAGVGSSGELLNPPSVINITQDDLDGCAAAVRAGGSAVRSWVPGSDYANVSCPPLPSVACVDSIVCHPEHSKALVLTIADPGQQSFGDRYSCGMAGGSGYGQTPGWPPQANTVTLPDICTFGALDFYGNSMESVSSVTITQADLDSCTGAGERLEIHSGSNCVWPPPLGPMPRSPPSPSTPRETTQVDTVAAGFASAAIAVILGGCLCAVVVCIRKSGFAIAPRPPS